MKSIVAEWKGGVTERIASEYKEKEGLVSGFEKDLNIWIETISIVSFQLLDDKFHRLN